MNIKLILSYSLSTITLLFAEKRNPVPIRVQTYYFDVISQINSGQGLFDYQVRRRSVPFINPGDVCSGFSKLCVVGFLTSQLTSGKIHLETGAFPLEYPILPAITVSTRF